MTRNAHRLDGLDTCEMTCDSMMPCVLALWLTEAKVILRKTILGALFTGTMRTKTSWVVLGPGSNTSASAAVCASSIRVKAM